MHGITSSLTILVGMPPPPYVHTQHNRYVIDFLLMASPLSLVPSHFSIRICTRYHLEAILFKSLHLVHYLEANTDTILFHCLAGVIVFQTD